MRPFVVLETARQPEGLVALAALELLDALVVLQVFVQLRAQWEQEATESALVRGPVRMLFLDVSGKEVQVVIDLGTALALVLLGRRLGSLELHFFLFFH